MTVTLQIFLLIGSLVALIYTAVTVRKSDVKIMDMFSWIILSVLLVFMSLFPQVMSWLAHFFGFESPVNFIFLVIICFLLFRCFSLSIQLSREKEKIRSAIEELAIKMNESGEGYKDENTVS